MMVNKTNYTTKTVHKYLPHKRHWNDQHPPLFAGRPPLAFASIAYTACSLDSSHGGCFEADKLAGRRHIAIVYTAWRLNILTWVLKTVMLDNEWGSMTNTRWTPNTCSSRERDELALLVSVRADVMCASRKAVSWPIRMHKVHIHT